MIPNQGSVRPPGRTIVLLTTLKRASLRLGTVSQAFFRKGEELEAVQFENLPHDDPMLVPPRLGFRSFDRVPRYRGRMLIALLLVAVAAVALVRWRSVGDFRSDTRRVAASVRATASNGWNRLMALVGASSGRDSR